MRIRSRFLTKLVAVSGGSLLRAWLGTLRYYNYRFDPTVDSTRPEFRGRYLYAFWHEMMLQPVYTQRNHGIRILVSRHGDGEYIAEIGRQLGFGVVRGSTRRGGLEAIRALMRESEHFNIAISVDGPRGPRREVKPGIVYVSSRTGLPIVPCGFAFSRPWRAKSWDRFAVPKPFSRATSVTGLPIAVPANLDRKGIERYRLRVQQALVHVTDLAEGWIETGGESPLEGIPKPKPHFHDRARVPLEPSGDDRTAKDQPGPGSGRPGAEV